MSVKFDLPELDEAIERLDDLFATDFNSNDEAMQDWVAVRFALNAQKTAHNSDYAKCCKSTAYFKKHLDPLVTKCPICGNTIA